jgi:disulfide bond formation protein DsbB
MTGFVTSFNWIVGILIVVAQAISVLLVLALVSKKKSPSLSRFIEFISKKGVWIAFLAALGASLGSLVYSEFIGYEPCKLCWIQRIFLFPQVIILGLALMRKESEARIYALTLSIIGGMVAVFHYIGGLGLNPLGLNCLAAGTAGSCSKNFVEMFGYINIPMMSFTVFLFIILVLALSIKAEKEKVRIA